MTNTDILQKLHETLFDLIKILRGNNGLNYFPRFVTIYGQISNALNDPDAVNDLTFLEDVKLSILGIYSHGGSGSFLDYGIWRDNDNERRAVNKRFNELRDELPKLARSLQTY